MTEAAEHTVQCSCGAVSVTLTGAPLHSAACCCDECRSRTGAAFGVSAYFDRSSVRRMVGEPTTYRRYSGRGRALDFRFCPVCGVTVWWTSEFRPGQIGVAGGLLEGFRPDAAYFCRAKPDWIRFADDVPSGSEHKVELLG